VEAVSPREVFEGREGRGEDERGKGGRAYPLVGEVGDAAGAVDGEGFFARVGVRRLEGEGCAWGGGEEDAFAGEEHEAFVLVEHDPAVAASAESA